MQQKDFERKIYQEKCMKYKCIICGTVHDGGLYEDPCPCCQWIPIHKDNVSSEDEYDYINGTTIREAKTSTLKAWTDLETP